MEELNNNQEVETQETEVKTYSQEEVDKLIQQASDKRVSQALETAKQKWEKETTAAKLASMSESEQVNHLKEQLEQEKAELHKEKVFMEVSKQFAAKNLPASFAKYVGGTAEEVAETLAQFETEWQEALEQALKQKLATGSHSPKSSNSQGKLMTKEEFQALSYNDRLKLYKENPELFNKLSK